MDERRASSPEGPDVAGFVVGRPILPAAEEDADPLEGQGTEGGMMAFPAFSLEVVEGAGPGGVLDGESGELVESLAEEGGSGPPLVCPP